MRVKRLTWKQINTAHYAYGMHGTEYEVAPFNKGGCRAVVYRSTLDGFSPGEYSLHPTLKEAKAWCQEDFERQVTREYLE